MSKASIFSQENIAQREVELSDTVFAVPFRPDILHFVVNWQLARRRSGTHFAKERSDVITSNRKLVAQKGTGRARRSTAAAPQFRGGGVVFAPHTRNYDFRVNKKVRRLALRVALSHMLREDKIVILDNLALETGKATALLNILKSFDIRGRSRALLVDDVIDSNVSKASSNLRSFRALPASALNVLSVISCDRLFLTLAALKRIEEVL